MLIRLLKNNFILVFLLSAIIWGCDSKKEQISPMASTLEAYFDSLAQYEQFNGAFAYKEGDKITAEKAYGYANFEKETPFKPTTQMEIASVSKQFTSTAIMMLHEKGLIDLDKPVNNYLEKPLPYDSITVRHLLTHTSGLPSYETYFYTNWPVDQPCYNTDILDYYRTHDVPLDFQPCTNFQYSNGGYVVLAQVVEFVSGKTLDRYLDENIFQPYGMNHTAFYERNTILSRENYAPGYSFDEEQNRMILPDSLKGKEYVSYLSYRLGPGRLSSTVEDLAIWDNLLKSGKLISDTTLMQLYTPQPIPGVESNYAFGWRVNRDSTLGYHIYHTGAWAGNKTYIGRFMQSPFGNKKKIEKQKSSLPDQTIIIFSNTEWAKMKEAHTHADSLILDSRKIQMEKSAGMSAGKALIKNDAVVAGLLFILLALIFYTSSLSTKFWSKFYSFVPAILLCYFLPGLLNTFGVVDGKNSSLYHVASNYFLPVSLVLLTLSIDIKSMIKLGPKAVVMFLAGSVGIIIGGPLAILIISAFHPDWMVYNGESIWKGMVTIAGSWIGGGANQAAMLEIFKPSKDLFSQLVAVDVIWANIWMAVLLYFAAKPHILDRKFKADSSSIDSILEHVLEFQKKVSRPATLSDMMILLGIGFGVTAIAHLLADAIAPWLAYHYPQLERFSLTSKFFWIVILATTIGIVLSFTKVRNLEGVGASKFGSIFLYFLVATIGMNMNLRYLADNPQFFLIGGIWILTHMTILIITARLIKAPFFFLAVGSQANIGGPVSAPIVASAFNPALAPVGVLLAVFGYAVGTYGAYVCGIFMQMVSP